MTTLLIVGYVVVWIIASFLLYASDPDGDYFSVGSDAAIAGLFWPLILAFGIVCLPFVVVGALISAVVDR